MFVSCLVGCGSRRNPNKCCVDAVDCSEIGLPQGSTCPLGELCRGHECIELTCAMSSECDATAKFCNDGSCGEQCASDASCPGFGEISLPYCVSGDCVECRDGNDCPDNLICEANACRTCTTDTQCESGLCAQGHCAPGDTVAYTHPTGSATSNCTMTDPCTLLRALTITPPRENIKLAAGTYQNTGTVALVGTRTLSGNGTDKTSVTNTGAGPVFTIDSGDSTIANMKIFGATTASGVGIKCPTTIGSPRLQLDNVLVTQNSSDGLLSNDCGLKVQGSTFSNNGGFGARLIGTDGSAGDVFLVERSMFSQNASGIKATGAGTLRNLFVLKHPTGIGAELQSEPMARVKLEFSTLAENNTGISCIAAGFDTSALANIVTVNNSINVFDSMTQPKCTYSACRQSKPAQIGAPCVGYDLSQLGLDSLTYHLSDDFSVLVNAAAGTTALDYDGEARPKGTASDIGADEAF